ncbi:prepilin peptidase [Alicyclobacillus ferrooxydans]|uniref:Prepilin type IV endopeptidase peptidase domain-containing protein n=1 Tax=Alicyclobacillus ferrooxydans TaxID=471514 RepID=A0A0P9EMR5_9BACL|nr:A24 family peptidase [Alicyclobacillus ferrooxydans]KPV44695.1 hypothetical protein AN477_05775 [Alicyclobacillus ferrooxydans]
MWKNEWIRLFLENTWQWHSNIVLMLWGGLVVYTAISAWTDLRERRIPNKWTALWLLLFLSIHFANRTFESSLLSFILMAVLMFVPTLLGVWGQGDWKMSMVLGAAIGALPALLVWFIGFLFVPILKPGMRRISLRYLPAEQALSIPVAVPIFSAVTLLFALLWFFNTM